MRASRFAIPVLALLPGLPACQSFEKEPASEVLQSEPDKVHGFDVPAAAPLRDPHTSYFKVMRDTTVVGYVVRYDALPAGSQAARPYREGTLLVEDAQFARIGFITPLGRGFRFRAKGQDADELGEGTIEELLPKFFGAEGLVLAPLR
jgi:hypothetical protein